MIDSDLLHHLQGIVGESHVTTQSTDLEVYSYDASLAAGAPGAIVFPRDTKETSAVVLAARSARVPCVPRGFGTNLSGGSIPLEGGLVICLSRMTRILSITPESRSAVVEPCVTNLELQEAVAPLGFFYAPDPASQKVATLGGNVAENSGGPHCIKYGVTKNHVLGLQLVLPNGEVLRLGGPAPHTPGMDLCGIIVGSEGTLGIVTEITLRILPSPESVVTLLAIYDDVADAARSVSRIMAEGIVPAALEMMDGPVMRAVEESYPCGYPLDAAAVLIIEVDGPAAGLQTEAEKIEQICRTHGCRSVRQAKDGAERDLLWAGRRGAFGAVARLAPNYLVADGTVPRTKLPEALSTVAAVAKRYQLSHGNVFHAGDGNLHPLLFFDSRDPDQVQRVHEAGWEIMKACVSLGGTITGEHGIGMEKIHGMPLIFSEDDLDAQRNLRDAFDPDGLFNPGKVLPKRKETEVRSEPPKKTPSGTSELIPADAREASDMVRCAYLDRTPLQPRGRGRRLDFGNASEITMVPIQSTRLDTVVEYDPDNQFITLGAGMPLSSLQEVLAAERQWLPIRPMGGEKGTVGGLLALNDCGPEALRYGAPRDLLLGLKFVSGSGRLISTGGKVLKNVAGYDLGRLLAGSAGTLGFLTELTLKVSPIPKIGKAVSASGTFEKIAAASDTLIRSNLEPALVTALPAEGVAGDDRIDCEKGPWRVTVGFEGFEETVDWQVDRCTTLLTDQSLKNPALQDYEPCKGLLREQQDPPNRFNFLLRADLPLDRVENFTRSLTGALRAGWVFVDFGCGRVVVAASDMQDGPWETLSGRALDLSGHLMVEKAPAVFKKDHDVFGPVRPEWKIMHKAKEALDPHRIFSPGHLPGKK